ncbi:adenylyl-sulfate kinase [bacterium]|nr:adenylyl-sulfate kinase [bacterium]
MEKGITENTKSKNIAWHEGEITEEDRQRLNGHKAVTVWLTGLPSSGKSTIARELEKRLFGMCVRAYVLDGDNVRHGLNRNLGFSPEDREENIRRIGEVAALFTDAGMVCITAFISPYRKDREAARKTVGEDRFVEVYCSCSLKECEKRDPKGLYKKARNGEIAEFTGISAPYEEPLSPDVRLETDRFDVNEEVALIISHLREKGFLRKED